MRVVVLTLSSLVLGGAVTAQEILPWPSLPNPGARSLGLGGAFVAQADDATAAFANPAGLGQLLEPEISAELRLWVDDDDDPDNDLDDLTGVGFASFVFPRGRWAVAVYRNQVTRYDLDLDVLGASGEQVEVTTTGVAGSVRLGERLQLGLGVTHNQGKVVFAGDDGTSDVGVTAGVLWRPHRSWQVGGAYRQGATLDGEATTIELPDVAAVGCAFRSDGGHLTVSGELDRIMVEGLEAVAHEAHLGLEYAFLGSPVVALRAGTWRTFDDQRVAEEEVHWATGFGLAFERVQLDFAVDVADPVWTASASAIFSF